MNYIVYAIRGWGWFYLPRFCVSLLHIVAFALFAEFLSKLPEFGFSYSQSKGTLAFIFFVFALVPLANMLISSFMRIKVAKTVGENFGSSFTYLHNHPSILGKSIFTICQFCDLPLVFIEIPITFAIFCFLQRSNLICFVISVLVSIFPLLISFLLGKNKIANATRIFESQNQRSAVFDKWLKNANKRNLSKNIFKKELKARKTESFLDESSNILPHSTILIILALLFWLRVLELQEIIIIYITSTLFLEKVTQFYMSISQLVQVNKSYLILAQKE